MLSWCITLALVATIPILFYTWLALINSYWKKRGVPCARTELFFGSTRSLFFVTKSYGDVFNNIYHELEGHSFGGFYLLTAPYIMPRDPQLVRRILVKDFNYFQDRGIRANKYTDPLTQHIYLSDGDLWRDLRAHMSTAFTPAKTRRMFFLVEECCRRMLRYYDDKCRGAPYRDIDIKEAVSRFTIDVIGMCIYGIECGALDDANSQFRHISKKIFEETCLDAFRKVFVMSMHELASCLGVGYFPSDVKEFFFRIFQETEEYRKKNKLQRDDLLHLLLQLKEKGLLEKPDQLNDAKKSGYSDEVLISNAFLVFFVGLEMISASMCFCLFELAMHPVIQNKVRREVDTVLQRYGGELTFEGVQEMTYLEQVVSETLRLYPPMSFLFRKCTLPYRVPESSVVLERGVGVLVPLMSIQRDSKHFEQPLEFKPERFPDAANHPAFMPFGDGPRTCMGQVFAMAEVKAGVAALISQYEFGKSPRTPSRPPPIDPRKLFTTPAGGLWLKVSRRSWLPAE